MARKFQSESVACSVNVIRGGGDNLVFGKESQASKPKPILRPYFSVSSSFSFFLLFSSSESTSERKRRRDEHNYFNRLVSVFSTWETYSSHLVILCFLSSSSVTGKSVLFGLALARLLTDLESIDFFSLQLEKNSFAAAAAIAFGSSLPLLLLLKTTTATTYQIKIMMMMTSSFLRLFVRSYD